MPIPPEIIGIAYALAAALFWGSWMVPVKSSLVGNDLKMLLFSIGGLLLSLIAFELSPATMSPVAFAVAFCAGIIWAGAAAAFVKSVEVLGIARSSAISSSLQILISFVWGIFLLAEFSRGGGALWLGLGGALLLAIAAIVVSFSHEQVGGATASSGIRLGILYIAVSAIMWGSYFVPLKFTYYPSPTAVTLPLAIGIFVGHLAVALPSLKDSTASVRDIGLNALGGMLWGAGNLFALYAIDALGYARGFSLTQIAMFVAVAWGALYFHEFTSKRSIRMVVAAVITAFIGAVLIAMAQG